eukprot:UC4_evm2s1442
MEEKEANKIKALKEKMEKEGAEKKRVMKPIMDSIDSRNLKELRRNLAIIEKEKIVDKEAITFAKQKIKEFEVEDEINDAIQIRELIPIEKAIENVRDNGMEAKLSAEVTKAKKIQEHLKLLEEMKKRVQGLKQSQIAELKTCELL